METLRDVMLNDETLDFFRNAREQYSFSLNEQYLLDKVLDMHFLDYLGICQLIQVIDPDDIPHNAAACPQLYQLIHLLAGYGITKLVEKLDEGRRNVQG